MGKVQSENSVHHFAKVSGLNERARGGGGHCFSTSELAAKMLTALRSVFREAAGRGQGCDATMI